MMNYLDTKGNMDDCLYGNIARVLKDWNFFDYEILGADAWSFEFIKSNQLYSSKYVDSIWNRIHAFSKDCWLSLERYYGVTITWHYVETVVESLQIIQNELEEERPVLVYINSRFCPWHPRKDEDHMHFCLVIGKDENCDNLYCVDASLNIENAELPISLYSQGYGPCITFSKLNGICKSIDWKEIIKNTLMRLKSSDAFVSMKLLSKELDDEINNCTGIPIWIENPIPVVINVNLIQKGRIYFANTLNYLTNKYGCEELNKVANELVMAAKMWNSILFMVYRIKLNQEGRCLLHKIPQKIIEISKFEEKIALNCMRIINFNNEKEAIQCQN